MSDVIAQTTRRCLATIMTDDGRWVVAETPAEAEQLVAAAEEVDAPFVQFTLANASEWNGRTVRIRTAGITAIAPPLSLEDAP